MQKKNLHTIGLSLEDCQAWLNALKSVKILFVCIYMPPHFSQRSFLEKIVYYIWLYQYELHLEKNVYYIWQITVLKIMDIILPSHSTMFLMAVKNFSSSFSGLVSSYLRYVFPPCFYNVRFIITCQNWYQYKNGLYGPN